MLNTDFELDQKSISRLASSGLGADVLKSQLQCGLDTSLEMWKSQGLNIIKNRGYFYFDTKFIPIEEAEFCIVDIETNGSKVQKHQIIEIAAVKVKNGVITASFESLVKCDEINEHIVQLTGISVQDTQHAPNPKDVLKKFKLFLGDAIFIAHDVKFDYKFISDSLEKFGLEPLLNRSLCSLALAERTLTSYRYALSYLNDYFDLYPEATHHRAMSDVLTTYELFKLSLQNGSENMNNVEDLIKFSKEAKRLKRPKFNPLLKEEKEE